MKDMEKLFDLMVHRQDKPGENFDGVDDRGQQRVIRSAIQSFMRAPAMTGFDRFGNPVAFDVRRPIQAFTGSSDLPQLTKDVFDVTSPVQNFDLSWQDAFKSMKLKKGQLNWEIAEVSAGGGFELIPEGGKVKIESVSGDTAVVGVNKYGYGLGVTWETIEGRKLYAFVDQMEQARAKMYDVWGNTHYALINTAAAVNTTAWAGAGTDPTVDRDIATINAAAYAIANACKDKGYGDMAGARLIMYINPKYRSRMNAALKTVSNDAIAGRTAGAAGSLGAQTLDWNVEVRYTFNSNIAADKGVMVLPGMKIQNAMYLRELGLSRQEIESLNELRTYWTAFGAAVGDNDQANQLSFS